MGNGFSVFDAETHWLLAIELAIEFPRGPQRRDERSDKASDTGKTKWSKQETMDTQGKMDRADRTAPL